MLRTCLIRTLACRAFLMALIQFPSPLGIYHPPLAWCIGHRAGHPTDRVDHSWWTRHRSGPRSASAWGTRSSPWRTSCSGCSSKPVGSSNVVLGRHDFCSNEGRSKKRNLKDSIRFLLGNQSCKTLQSEVMRKFTRKHVGFTRKCINGCFGSC